MARKMFFGAAMGGALGLVAAYLAYAAYNRPASQRALNRRLVDLDRAELLERAMFAHRGGEAFDAVL